MIRGPRRSPPFPYTPLSRPRDGHPRRRLLRRHRHELGLDDDGPHRTPPLLPAEGAQGEEDEYAEHDGRREHGERQAPGGEEARDRKSTRLNSSHSQISYAVF